MAVPGETLTVNDAVDICEEILPAQSKSYELGLKLKLPQHVVEAINSKDLSSEKYLLKIIIAFLQQQGELGPTWRVIVDALRSPIIGLTALAREVERAHIPSLSSSSDNVSKTIHTESTVNPTSDEVKSKPQSVVDDETQTGSLPQQKKTKMVMTCSVEEVEADISHLHQRFNSLKDLTIRALKNCKVAVMTVVYILTNICTVKDHQFLKENHKALRQSDDHLELFGSLNFYWNYLSYDLLDHLISELDKKHKDKDFNPVILEMALYKKDIQTFRKRTPLILFCQAEPQSHYEDPPDGFKKMVVKFDWPNDTKTLEDVEMFRRRYASNYDLPTCAMMLNSIGTGSVTVTFFIHVSVVDLLKKKRVLDLFIGFNVIKLELFTMTTNVIYQKSIQRQRPLKVQVSSRVADEMVYFAGAQSDTITQYDWSVLPRLPVQRPLKLTWKEGENVPVHGLVRASSVLIDGMVYCAVPQSDTIVQYNPTSGDWSFLPRLPVKDFAITSLNNQLVAIGGTDDDNNIRVWDSSCEDWDHPYPPMPVGQSRSAAVGYHQYLIIACGALSNDVSVLDTSSSRWYIAQSVPVVPYLHLSSVVIGEYWYLSSFGGWSDGKRHILWVHLPTLISSALTTRPKPIWHVLLKPPVSSPTLLALNGNLLLVGGKRCVKDIYSYDQEANEWRHCGELPIGLYAPCCAVLPSGELMVAGGLTWMDSLLYLRITWTAEIIN